jgi:hypothetical protein
MKRLKYYQDCYCIKNRYRSDDGTPIHLKGKIYKVVTEGWYDITTGEYDEINQRFMKTGEVMKYVGLETENRKISNWGHGKFCDAPFKYRYDYDGKGEDGIITEDDDYCYFRFEDYFVSSLKKLRKEKLKNINLIN